MMGGAQETAAPVVVTKKGTKRLHRLGGGSGGGLGDRRFGYSYVNSSQASSMTRRNDEFVNNHGNYPTPADLMGGDPADEAAYLNPQFNLRVEADRLKTFTRWSNPAVPVEELAKWGFFYTGRRDLVECAFCHGKLQDWRSCDDPRAEHERNYGDCPFVLGYAAEKRNNETNHFSFSGHASSSTDSATSSNAVPEYSYQTTLSVAVASNNNQNQNNSSSSSNNSYNNNNAASGAPGPNNYNHVTPAGAAGHGGNGNGSGNGNKKVDYEHCYSANNRKGECSPIEDKLRDLNIFTSKPVVSHMVTYQARLASFERWPKSKTHNAEELAEAGFYFTGENDRVRCFYCGIALHNWLPNDSPWAEHERWNAKCDYVAMCKNMGSAGCVAAGGNGGNAKNVLEKGELEEKRELVRETFESIDDKGTLDDLDAKTPCWRGEDQVRFALEAGYDEDMIAKALITNSCVMFTSAMDLIDRVEALRLIQESLNPVETGGGGGGNGNNAEAASPKIAKEAIRDSKLCQICMDAEISIVLLPCAHLVCCPRCSPALRSCPICRSESVGRLRIFM